VRAPQPSVGASIRFAGRRKPPRFSTVSARMLRHRKSAVGVIFIGRPERADLADGLGEFMPQPVDTQAVIDAVGRLLGATRAGAG